MGTKKREPTLEAIPILKRPIKVDAGQMDEFKELLLSRMPIRTVLDFGCGYGKNMKLFSLHGRRCVGLDASVTVLRLAKNYGEVILGSGGCLPLKNNCLDLTVSEHVLHHIADPRLGLSEIARCLRTGGFLLCYEVIEDNPLISVGRSIHPYYEGIPVKSRFRKEELIKWLEDLNFRILRERRHLHTLDLGDPRPALQVSASSNSCIRFIGDLPTQTVTSRALVLSRTTLSVILSAKSVSFQRFLPK